MEFIIKMDDECKEKVTPDEAKEIFSIGQQVVEEFRQAYPGSHIDKVVLDMHCKEEIDCPQPIDKIVIIMQRKDATPGQSDSISIKSGAIGEVFDDDLPHIDGESLICVTECIGD